MRVRVPIADLRRLPAAETADPEPVSQASPGLEKALQVATSVDLRGLAADDAILELDKYLDDAVLAGLERVIVIHGKGTGALRHAVRVHLSRHPEVAAFRLGGDGEGGTGATIVELARR
ncbi:MAG TPA: Smr/MutS family protein, partial [bacterium]|nr:Smr/MutS family protein [bacterium]